MRVSEKLAYVDLKAGTSSAQFRRAGIPATHPYSLPEQLYRSFVVYLCALILGASFPRRWESSLRIFLAIAPAALCLVASPHSLFLQVLARAPVGIKFTK
jgi:hypothetical protein